MTYSEKLKHPKWQKKRLEILNRDNFKCVICDDTETTLHVHHDSYKGNPWEAENDQLRTICEHCHSFIHQDNEPKKAFKYFDEIMLQKFYVFIGSQGFAMYLIDSKNKVEDDPFSMCSNELLEKIYKTIFIKK